MLPNALPRSSVLQRADSVYRKFMQCRRCIAATEKIIPSQVDYLFSALYQQLPVQICSIVGVQTPNMSNMDMIAASRQYIDKIVGHKALRKEANVGKVMLLDGFTTQVHDER